VGRYWTCRPTGKILPLPLEDRFGEPLEDIHRRKTGALFRRRCRMGVFAARGPECTRDELKAADDFACVGLAFQCDGRFAGRRWEFSIAGKRAKGRCPGKLTYPGLLEWRRAAGWAARLSAEAEAAPGMSGRPGDGWSPSPGS